VYSFILLTFQIAITLGNIYSRYLDYDVTELNQTYDSYDFMFLWLNKEHIEQYYTEFCATFQLDFLSADDRHIRNFRIAFCTIGGAILLYLTFYFPMTYLFLKQRSDILQVFLGIPKEVVGKIYQELCKNIDEESSFHSWTIPGKFKVVLSIVLVIVAETICIGLLMYAGVVEVHNDKGSSEVIQVAGQVVKHMSKTSFLVSEYYYSNMMIPSEVFSDQISAEIDSMRSTWNRLRFGSGTNSGKGLLGKDNRIDRVVLKYSCDDKNDFNCWPMNTVVEELDTKAKQFLKEMFAASKELNEERLLELYLYARKAHETMDSLLRVYVTVVDSQEDSSVNIYWLIGMYFPITILLFFPVYFAIANYVNENHQIRQLLHFLPTDTIEALPVLREYIFNFTTLRKKKEKQNDSKIEAIIEAAADGVILATESGIINVFNASAQRMFEYEQSQIIGMSFTILFTDANEIQMAIHQMTKKKESTGVVREFTGKRKNGKQFPVLLSLSVSMFEKKRIISAFCRDLTTDKKQKDLLSLEKKNSEELLLNILPGPVAHRLKNGEALIAEEFDDVTILFSDICGFTAMSSKMRASDIVTMLNTLIYKFDQLVSDMGVEKVKTIGDAYFAVGGLHQSHTDHPEKMCLLAISMLKIIEEYNKENNSNIQMRIGLHTGSVAAGVIGMTKFTYDLWGDSVNTASRMESTSEPNRIQLSRDTYQRVHDIFECEERQGVSVKGKGVLNTYMLIGPMESAMPLVRKMSIIEKPVTVERTSFEKQEPASIYSSLSRQQSFQRNASSHSFKAKSSLRKSDLAKLSGRERRTSLSSALTSLATNLPLMLPPLEQPKLRRLSDSVYQELKRDEEEDEVVTIVRSQEMENQELVNNEEEEQQNL
jgi:PAS domain S-box-containing protein